MAAGEPPGIPLPKPNSDHIGIISITVGARRTGWNAMKPRIQCALTH
jgi:hypothetical protein